MFSGQRVTQVFFAQIIVAAANLMGFPPKNNSAKKKFTLVFSRNFAFFSYFVTEKMQNFEKSNYERNFLHFFAIVFVGNLISITFS